MKSTRQKRTLYAGGLLIVALLGFAFYRIWMLHEKAIDLGNNVKELTESLDNTRQELLRTEEENARLSEDLDGTKNRLNYYEEEVRGNKHIITNLEKLTQTDPELLKKYSKVYFLNENYVPEGLSEIPYEYLYVKNKAIQVHVKVLPYLSNLLSAALASSAPLEIVSGYRSFGTQASLKSNYRVTYGAGTANQFSAEQGYSEHQLGTAVDFTASSTTPFNNFEKSPAFAWLQEHAHQHGFILSYPKQNKYYQFEPWHWRFVGIELATKLHDSGQYFYDIDQRDIDQYLIKLFNAN
ncbi:MAG TPA: M15 family metallopeptidase [Candidatus Paceibacterota bacterium]